MQFSAVEIRFIVTTYLYSTFANDLKRKYFFSKMFIVTEYAALNIDNDYKIRCHTFDRESAMVLEPITMEYKQ